MALIVIYILSVFFVYFINVESLRIAGIFIGIAYIPGLCLVTLGKKEKITVEDLFLSFPYSIGISSLLILGLLYIGVNVKHIFYIIHAMTGVIVLLYAVTRNKNKPYITIKLNKQELIFCFSALLMTLLLAIPNIFGSRRAFWHSSLVTQIINGIFPPENPGLGGTYLSYHWGFHAFIAALSAPMNFHPLRVISILNLLALFMVFWLVYRSAKALGLSEGYRYLASLAVIGLMRADVFMLLALNLFSGNFPPIQDLGQLSNWEIYKTLTMLNQNFPIGDLRMRFLPKFYGATAMPLSISLTYSYFLILLILLKRNIMDKMDKTVYLTGLCLVIIAGVFIYMPLSIIPLLHIPLWAGFIFLFNRNSSTGKFRESSEILIPYAIAVILTLPYLLFVLKGGRIDEGQIISLDLYIQSAKNLFVFWLSLPVIIAGIWIATKRLTSSRESLFLLTGTLLTLGLTVFMHLTFNSSYKFTYILVFFFALFFVFALSAWLPSISNRWLKGFITASIILLLLSNPILVETSYILSSGFRDTTYTFSGNHIVYTDDDQKNELYTWIRENTPPEALIILPYVELDHKKRGSPTHKHYKLAALTERNMFVIKEELFTASNPELAKRVIIRKQLFEEPDNPQLTEFFALLNRPIYLLVEEEFNRLPEKTEQGLVLVFQNEKGRVYLLREKLQKNTT